MRCEEFNRRVEKSGGKEENVMKEGRMEGKKKEGWKERRKKGRKEGWMEGRKEG